MNYFFYSPEQEKMFHKTEPFYCSINKLPYYGKRNNFVKINEKWMKYTECCLQRKPFGYWGDYVYLGELRNNDLCSCIYCS